MLGRVSVFHKEVQERKLVKDDVMWKAFIAAYWLVKEEVSNRKFSSLVNLFTVLGFDEMKHFQYSAQGSIRNIFSTGRLSSQQLVGKSEESVLLWSPD